MVLFEDFYGSDASIFPKSKEREDVLLLKQFIDCIEALVHNAEVENKVCYEGICYLFAKSVVDSCKMAYDNILLGHLDIAKMIMRIILENMVSLDIITTYKGMELWKYYYMHFMWNRYEEMGKGAVSRKTINEMCTNFNIRSNDMKKYLKYKYGWTYPLYTDTSNKKFTFHDMCNLDLTEEVYKSYNEYSGYVHGNSVLKEESKRNVSDDILDSIWSVYSIAIRPLYNIYGNEKTAEKFSELEKRLEDNMNLYILESDLMILEDDYI